MIQDSGEPVVRFTTNDFWKFPLQGENWPMSVTKLLPPAAAVRMIWARTSEFSSEDARPKISVVEIETLLKEIKDKADKDDPERAYVQQCHCLHECLFEEPRDDLQGAGAAFQGEREDPIGLS